jgi:orotate phosphoribosyltransferase
MTNVPLNKEAVDQYLSKVTKESILGFLEKNNFEKIRSLCLQDTEEKLVKLMIDCNVFVVKTDQETIENGQKSCFYIHVLEIIEKGHSDTLSSIFANFIQNSINNDEFDRVVGLLCTRYGDDHNISRERYNLAPVTASNLKKPPFELLFRENGSSDQPMFLMNGKINRNEKVILIDEMITTGENIKRAIKHLRDNEDVEIKEVFILVSRTSEQKLKNIKKSLSDEFGVNLHCILSIEKLLDSLRQQKRISLEEYNRVSEEIA